MAASSFLLMFLVSLILIAATVESRQATAYFPGSVAHSSQEEAAKTLKHDETPYKTQYFPQILDHFNFQPESSKVFYQKYLINSKFWHKGAPIFVYTGNEGNIEWFANNTGFMLDIAPQFHALLVFIEHRYYGESKPFGNDSYKSAKTLGYLTSQQALADFAGLIRSLKQNLSSEASPVVVFGGSYGGMLAAWFRLKYPHIAIGALASSAPILQFDVITPWSSFYDAVSQDYKDVSSSCYDVIKGSWDELFAMSTTANSLPQLSKTFKTCKIIDDLPAGTSKLIKTFAAASLYYNYSSTEKCFNIGKGSTDTHGLHGWDWQACTEMVMPMTCSNESMFPPFSFDYKRFEEDCLSTFGVKPRPHWITTEFGGSRIEQVLKRFGSNIIFSNGMQDPWSRGSVLKNISESIVALVTRAAHGLGAHHLDLRSAIKEDPEWLTMQRRQEVEIIRKWIDQYHSDISSNANSEI
ncbi:hypothetical protein DCAR_0522164 [Daucus carota subsp. sativus]|uniref:Lysosomal Pro-X carboxypeptidase n=1 Tax=Daucus carota subsp. sativus TaxID=79200 RepID=A0AAF0X7D7_DAUCS|nr:hypothetical protein DCAR_0522164 [Daucus carota subsp. sativus]